MRHLIAFIICISMSLALFSQADAVTIRIGSDEGIFGSEVMIPVTTENFTDILSAQGSISFDSDLLNFVGTEQYGLPGLNAASFGTTQTASGFLTFSWYDEMLNGVSLSDGDLLFSIRFEIADNTAQGTPILLCSDFTPIEIVNSSYNMLTVFDQTGQVTILENPNPGSELSIGFSNHTVAEGQEIIVPVEVTNFNDIVSMQGSIFWDETVVTYLSTEAYNLQDMSNSNFGTSQTTSGILTFSWNDIDLSGESLTDGQSVFSIRFLASGNVGENSNLNLVNHPTALEFTDTSLNSIDYTTIPGLVTIENTSPTSDVSILADSVEGGMGAVVQLPVRVSDFTDIISLQGSLSFNPSIAEFDTIIQYGLPSLAYANFGTTNADTGNLSFSWNDPTLSGVNLPQDSAIFVLQFTLIGNIGDISPLNFVQTPTPFECVKSNFTIINAEFSPGQMEIIDVYKLEITNISANEFCAGESFSIDYFAEGNYLPGNTFIAELSDEIGDFSSPTPVGNMTGTSSGTFTATLPADLPDGTYSIRLSATQPVYTSEIYETAIIVHQLPLADAGIDQEICLGQTAILTATGGIDYLWSTGENIAEISVNPTVDMEYIVSVEDAFGCENSDTVNLIVHPIPSAQAGADVDICLGESANLSASGGTDYLWSTGENLQAISITPTANTQYIVTVTDTNFCEDTDTVQVNVFEAIAEAGLDQNICVGESATLTANGGDDYLWSSGGNTASISANPTVDTEYYVTVTGINLCQDVDTVLVFVVNSPGVPDIPEGITNRCSAVSVDTFTITSVTEADTYIWETDILGFGNITSMDTMAIIEWSPDFYGELALFVTVENLCGNDISEHLIITTIETPEVFLGDDFTICAGDSTYLEGPENTSYLWSTGLDTQGIWANEAGIFWLEAMNDGCSSTDSIEIFLSDSEFSFDQDTIFTNLPSVLHSASGFESYLWSTNETGESITVTEPGWYDVSMWNDYGCEISDSVYMDDLTGIDLHEPFSFSVYPNPANEMIWIKSSNYPFQIKIYDITGGLIYQENIKTARPIKIKKLAPGTYVLELNFSGQKLVKKLIIL